MKSRVTVLLVVATVWCLGSTASGASLAARLQAAAVAAAQQPAAQQATAQQPAAQQPAAAPRAAAPVAAQRAAGRSDTLNVADWLDRAAQQRADAAAPHSARRAAPRIDAPAGSVTPARTAPEQLPSLHAPANTDNTEEAEEETPEGDDGARPGLLDADDALEAMPVDGLLPPILTPIEALDAALEGVEPPDEDEAPAEAEAETRAKTETSEAVEAEGTDGASPKVTESPSAAAAPPAPPARDFSPAMLRLRDKVRTCLSYYYQYPERVEERSPWGIMHSLISYGVDTELLVGNQRVNAIGWLCYNRPCRGITLMTTRNGQLVMKQNGPGYQGHDGQLLSMLALSGVSINYPIRVDGHEFTVADLVRYEQLTCKPKTELTFQLIGIAHYCPSDTVWKSATGISWDIPRLIREELAQPIQGATCGGTHRLIGLSMAVKTRQKRGEPLDGEWLRAAKFTAAYQAHAMKLQNRDGSFSTQWLARRDDSGTVDRRLQTTGHILEWLVFSLPEEDLTDPALVRSVNYLATLLLQRNHQWEVGPRGHALRALALYNERVFGDKPGQRRELLAQRPGK